MSEASLVLQQHERKKLLCDQQHRFRGPHLVLQELTEIASSSLFYSISGAEEQWSRRSTSPGIEEAEMKAESLLHHSVAAAILSLDRS